MEAIVKRIILEIKQGDEQAFAELVELYKDKVYQVAYRMVGNAHEAQDVAQEAFLRAYTNLDRFDTNRKFSTWIFRIATNVAIDRLRKKKPDFYLQDQVQGSRDLTYESQLAASDDLPEEQIVTAEMQEWVQGEINRLPVKYRTAIILKYLEDLSLKEISEIMDLPVSTVKTRIHRGREALRKRMRHL
ncbi:RNA polymerase sigma factor SigW [Alkalihalophilus pseudofirmus]|uniref:RNA polymerase sigma factor n=1 Tax=Alkalihalophilus pseudofirmus TaxID=79885 RepID=A0AAJ2NQZ2_ALKPS|nr:RNA polymerase sigma factor SigW [Alkalihalophilus pseudofirmus]MDV2887045.1 RNA polymerase sigma factor SigW [Alkalihalophilus pseudofirmus]OLS35461.1 RNA polymerase sigma factor SigW [Alkalihalophilus pseudofirmus]WEG17137.1 RNA polymerase sigma factor SigW [Alkalihalophilus pseudofirmus]